ncbi:MAG: hypothetical protein ACRCSV_01870, partial [Chlamydiales bacterium]
EIVIMSINIFNHPYKADIDRQLEPLTRSLRNGDTITAIHTPIVLPLNTSSEIGGYARSLELPFGPKWIALNCERFSKETSSVQEFILARQVALFDKRSRYLHLPIAVVAVAIATLASNILFPFSIVAAVSIPSIAALAGAAIIAKRERNNEYYADLIAFRNCDYHVKQNILIHLENKIEEEGIHRRPSFIKNIFSGYPSSQARYNRLFWDSQNTDNFRGFVRDRLEARRVASEIELQELF